MTPMIAMTLRSILNIISVSNAPTPAADSPDRMLAAVRIRAKVV
jgi:hypothetical protein